MPYTPNTPWVDGSGGGTPITAARLNNMEPAAFGAYFGYTPTWSGGSPVLGNAVVAARYAQIGKMVHAYGRITFGTTTTFGAGAYAFALPVAASANAVAGLTLGTWAILDSSAGAMATGTMAAASTTTMSLYYEATYYGTVAFVGPTAPYPLAQSDWITWNITYEAA